MVTCTTLLSVSWSLTSSESLTFTASSIIPEVEMNLFYYFSQVFFFLAILSILTYYAQYFVRSFNAVYVAS